MRTYQTKLREQLKENAYKVDSLIVAVRKQEVTQIFYLPELPYVLEESIVFFDRVHNISNDYVPREDIKKRRIFTLSDYGLYLFIFKLSLHFTRLQENIERKSFPPS